MNGRYDIALSFATEDQDLVEKVYHYLIAEKWNVFFSPSPEGQTFLSGKNQREAFYDIFGLRADYAALFVSAHYITKSVPMEEASIAFAKHGDDGHVIPVYLDETTLPQNMLDPKRTNYFKANNPAIIASHLASKLNMDKKRLQKPEEFNKTGDIMNIEGNTAEKQIFIQTLKGNIKL